jgi:hypothetical protein
MKFIKDFSKVGQSFSQGMIEEEEEEETAPDIIAPEQDASLLLETILVAFKRR